MPVKNKSRPTNDGLEGIIVGLTDEEKKLISSSTIIDLTKHITINSDLTSGKIDKEGYELVKDKDNVVFKYIKNEVVLVLLKECQGTNMELQTIYFENDKYYLVKFSITEGLMINISGFNLVDENYLLSELAMFQPSKTISLFGDKSILVPQSVKDTNYDIFKHSIHIIGTPTSTDFNIYFEFYSSKNTPCDSTLDLATLLGDEFIISCSGIARTKQAYAISKLEVKCIDGTTELLTGCTISDVVKTI